MLIDTEIKILCDTLRKCHVKATPVSLTDSVDTVIDMGLIDVFRNVNGLDFPLSRFIPKVEQHTMYRAMDEMKLCYIFFSLPTESDKNILFIGPYLPTAISSFELIELGEKMHVSPRSQRYFEEYYRSIPVLEEGDSLFVLIDTFCETVWNTQSFRIESLGEHPVFSFFTENKPPIRENDEDIMINIVALEKRYSLENQMIKAVSLGQTHKAKSLFANFTNNTGNMFEERLQDPLRNAKNYCIIMNTLLRKAAEQGGVHPMYLDKTSSYFAAKIEQLVSSSDSLSLMKEMFREFCELVRKTSTQSYSPPVQKAFLLIDSDLSGDLSLGSLANNLNISEGYLSAVFKKETGKTLSEHIRQKRIEYAKHLLTTTHLQVQMIAMHCGIMDVQYFSKIFKKQTGKTPKEYREQGHLIKPNSGD